MVRRTGAIFALCALGAMWFGACSPEVTYVTECKAGERDLCLGENDCEGERLCNDDGTYGSCECDTGSGGTATAAGSAGSQGKGGSGQGGRGGVGQGGSVDAAGGTGGVSSGGDGGSSPVSLDELIGKLDGFLIQYPCAGNPSTDDCGIAGYFFEGLLTPCSGNQSEALIDFPIAGTPGVIYSVRLHFYGISSPKDYGDDLKRESPLPSTNLDTGADPPPFYIGDPGESFPASNYDTREIHVYDQNDIEVGTYFLNSDFQEGHYTYVLDYERTIPIVGGGRVRFRALDLNCRIIKNCGATSGYPCADKARTVDISAASPQPPSGTAPNELDQPGLGEGADHGGQWLLIDVTGFTSP